MLAEKRLYEKVKHENEKAKVAKALAALEKIKQRKAEEEKKRKEAEAEKRRK